MCPGSVYCKPFTIEQTNGRKEENRNNDRDVLFARLSVFLGFDEK